jgi:uncharacterized protein (DUF58 family)
MSSYLDTKEVLKKVRRIEIKTKRISDHLFNGEYHSQFKGRGMAFSEVRAYAFGDDVRAIDWKVTARLNEPYIKVFEEERELTSLLMVDVSASEGFGSKGKSKRDIMTEISAILAFSAAGNNDKVGLILFSDRVEQYIPPGKGRKHILRIIRELVEYEPQHRGTNIAEALAFLNRVMRKKAIVFLLSDFWDNEYEKPMKIAAKRHDLCAIRIYDRLEKDLPKLGMLPIRDVETGQRIWVDTHSKKVRLAQREAFIKSEKQFHDILKKSGAGRINCDTQQNYTTELLNYFKAN